MSLLDFAVYIVGGGALAYAIAPAVRRVWWQVRGWWAEYQLLQIISPGNPTRARRILREAIAEAWRVR